MYNLLVSSSGWNGHRDTVILSRVYANEHDGWTTGSMPDFNRLQELPTIFALETSPHTGAQFAHIGQITKVKLQTQQVILDYRYDPSIPPIPQEELIALAPALDIALERKRSFGDLQHSAWYLKDADLFRVLFTSRNKPARLPTIFNVDAPQRVDPGLVAVMMPFKGFDAVWAGIKRAAALCGMEAKRADDFWEDRSIIQDIVRLIDRSTIVVCDCSEKNPNVFYEMGIADAFGKNVITITQHRDDIPFDVGHHRYIHYYNNDQGIQTLEAELGSRISTLRRLSHG